MLVDHLRNVGNMAWQFVHHKNIKDKDILEKIAYLMGIAHDFGKASVYFQNKLLRGEKTKKARHSLISAIWGYYIVKKYLMNHSISDTDLPIQVYMAISRHHGDLRNLRGVCSEKENLKEKKEFLIIQLNGIKKNIDEVGKIYRVLCKKEWIGIKDCSTEEFFENFDIIRKEIIRDIRRLKDGNVSFYLRFLFLYSILLDADKTDASNSNLPCRVDIPADAVDKYKRIKFRNAEGINKVREEIYSELTAFVEQFNPHKHRIMTIELPTGSGKTLTGFSLALKLRDKIKDTLGVTPRIIYSLPFLSIIEQTNHVLTDVLITVTNMNKLPSNLLLVHHHLADIMYETKEEEYDVSKSRILTEGWNSEVIITTFFQVMHSLITYRNSAVRKFHRFANSILILDEVQSIPHKYWGITNKILKTLSEEYNMWVVLMTATMPMLFSSKERIDLVKNPNKYYGSFNRVKYLIEKSKDLYDIVDEVWEKIKNGNDDIFVILNKVSAVKDMYKEIRNRLDEGNVNNIGIYKNDNHKLKLINLTTHILPKHRFKRISEIQKKDGYRKIVISTQLVEAGVDISSKELFRDIAPLDSIFQSGGRCNRGYEYGDLEGTVHIAPVIRDNKSLWKNIYDSVLINATERILKDHKRFEERDIRKIMRNYYLMLSSITASDHKVEEAIKNYNYGDLREFRLIEEKYPKKEVFVEIDDDAGEVLNKYISLREIKNPFERKNKFLEFKRKFYDYVISVPEETITKLGLSPEGEVYVIHRNDIESDLDKSIGKIYNLETGIIVSDNSLIL